MASSSDAQKSEVHDTTADASTSPAAAGDSETTRNRGTARSHESPKRNPEPLADDTIVIRDDSDDGGPIEFETGDPDLNPPQVRKDPFPTDRVPQIDPPISKRRDDHDEG